MRLRSIALIAVLALWVPGGATASTTLEADSDTSTAVAADVSKENFTRVGGVNESSGGHIAFEGDRLYLGTYGTGFRIFDISNPVEPALIGTYEPGGTRADAVPDTAVFDGRHIAILNGTSRVPNIPIPGGVIYTGTQRSEFLDVTDPANPELLWEFQGSADGEAHNGDIDDERRLWFPSGASGDNGLRIYDLNPILGSPPAAPARLWPPDACRTDPLIFCDPKTLWENSPHRQGRPVGENFQHTHDITLYNDHPVRQSNGTVQPRDILLLAEGGPYTRDNMNNGSVFVIDVTDPTTPVVLYRWLHETGGNHHPIRYHHEAQLLDGDPSVMLVTDEDLHNGCGSAGGVVAVRLNAGLTDGTELSEWFIPFGTPASICSAHVFSTVNNVMFMGSYNAGTQAIDYSDPSNPKQVGHFIAEGSTAWGAYFYRGYVFQGDMSRGLDVLQYLGPNVPKPAGAPTHCPGFKNSKRPQTIGTEQRDVLAGTKGRDVLCGLGGNDKIRGLGGNDVLIGGKGNDLLLGGAGRDRLRGGPGNDRMKGGKGMDRCSAGKGKDRSRGCERGSAKS